MRFAYIDSQGNEVPIPSIDALALRIELGAVGPDTQLYDAQADHWGPAHTHEIFHSLSRDSEDEGFMAPPPPVSTAPPVADAPSVPEADAGEPVAEREAAPPAGNDVETEEKDDGEVDFGLTLADSPPAPPEEEVVADSGDEPDLALDLAPAVESSAGPEPEPEPDEEDAGGDFDLGSSLEVEDSSVGEGMALETEMEFSSPPAGFDDGGDELELERPMSAFEPDSPPGWMEESPADDVMDFSAATVEEESTEDVPTKTAESPVRERRTAKDRPSPPKFKRQRSLSGPIVFVVVLLAIGVGGYVGWPIVQARLAEGNAPERPPVVMPAIPEELLPQMRSLAEAAIAAVVADVSTQTLVADAPVEPHEDWLAGVYLGNASRYAGTEAFWSSIQAFTQGLRGAEWQLYHDSYVEQVGQAGLGAEAAAQVTERADSGFVAAQPEREAALAELERLARAALDLHDFLIANEADIVYRPGVTSVNDPNVDPVLEITASDAAREEMLAQFDEITESLDALGSLDRVTRDRLVTAMSARLRQVGIE